MKIFSNFALKIMAIIFMVMDHTYTYLNRAEGINIPIWFGYIGKLAAPIFFYLIVEGFFHTKSRKKYMIRIFTMSIVMIGIDSILGINNNVFLSLGFGVALMSAIEYVKTKERWSKEFIFGIIVSIVFGIVLGMFTEASIFGLGMILIFYFFREKKILMVFVYVLFSLWGAFGMIGPNFFEAIFLWDYQWMMVFGIIPILLYNGKRGISNAFIKWMFYWFYPVHLIVIVAITKILGGM